MRLCDLVAPLDCILRTIGRRANLSGYILEIQNIFVLFNSSSVRGEVLIITLTCTHFNKRSSNNNINLYSLIFLNSGFSTLGEIDRVLLVGPIAPATYFMQPVSLQYFFRHPTTNLVTLTPKIIRILGQGCIFFRIKNGHAISFIFANSANKTL